MIKLQSLHIEKFRGIRRLTLELGQKSFVVRGPNGSGKSGVVDAIEFALTGEVSRLMGRGTGGLSVGAHGPHVDCRDDPESSFVRLEVFIPELNKTATITRRLNQPQKPSIEPDEEEVRNVFTEASTHPEVTLTRREIIKFILAEATKRSKDVQALLRLDSIDQTRATLKTAQNKLGSALASAESMRSGAREALLRHVGVEKFSNDGFLKAVNLRRKTLGLPDLVDLTPETELDVGLAGASASTKAVVDKASALRDIQALAEALSTLPTHGVAEASAILADLEEITGKPELASALKQRALVQTGLALLTEPLCPLCDTAWNLGELRDHLDEKLAHSKEAKAIQERMSLNAKVLADGATTIETLAKGAREVAATLGDDAAAAELLAWAEDLRGFASSMRAGDDISEWKNRLTAGWANVPSGMTQGITRLTASIGDLPEETGAKVATAFLTLAQDRWKAVQDSKVNEAGARRASDAAKAVYKAYCDAAELELGGLYKTVEERFSGYYKRINGADETGFEAKLQPSQSKLDLSVDFYERGMFPPGAYHSEGHQDGMGVCLYLALMKHLLGGRFTLAVLDDVVMSVDAEHRKEFCELLKSEFPETQFVITTHDRVWAEQMRTAGLVSSRSTAAFYGWTIDTGPIVEIVATAWEDIESDMNRDDIAGAAATLRRHLEAVSRELAGLIGARPTFRPDNSYDLGDLLPNVVSRLKELLGKAAKASQSWGDKDAGDSIRERKRVLSEAYVATGCKQWTINKAVHYNEWANFSREDFAPVVSAFRTLLAEFHCAKEDCASWIYVTPSRGQLDSLRCRCGKVSYNMREK